MAALPQTVTPHDSRFSSWPNPGREIRLRQLEDGITELAAHIDAAMYRWLLLVREYDESGGWAGPGLQSCAHWLNWKCGLALGTARERVRVAHALKDLPCISAALQASRVSYSKVRAMARVATPLNERTLVDIALSGTATHLERLVRHYRKIKRSEALKQDVRRHELRELAWYTDADGSFILKGRFTPEQGALIRQALEAALEEQFAEQEHVPAGTSDAAVVQWIDNADGEPLSVGRKTRTIPPAISRALRRRDGSCRFPACSATRFVDAHHIHHWADGGATRMKNLALLCRHHHRLVHEGGFGLRRTIEGTLEFTTPDGNPITAVPEARSRGNVLSLTDGNSETGIRITPKTPGVRFPRRWGICISRTTVR